MKGGCEKAVVVVMVLFLALVIASPAGGQRRIDRRETRGREHSSSMDKVLGVESVESVRIDVGVNVVFIGLSKDEFLLERVDFEQFFSHLSHSADHTTVPLVDGRILRKEHSVKQRVSYEFVESFFTILTCLSYNITAFKAPWEVGRVVSDAVGSWVRLDHVDEEGKKVVGYVDAHKVSRLIRDFLEKTGVSGKATVLVLRLDVSAPAALAVPEGFNFVYGYRGGFSPLEVEEASSFLSERKTGERSATRVAASADAQASIGVTDSTTFSELAHAWVKTQESMLAEAAELLDCEKTIEILVLERSRAKTLSSSIGTGSECLVDVWLSDDRFAFLDVAAGPFSWGRTIGGVGVKTEKTLPREIVRVSLEDLPSPPDGVLLDDRVDVPKDPKDNDGSASAETWRELHNRMRRFHTRSCMKRRRTRLSATDAELCESLDPIFSKYVPLDQRFAMLRKLIIGGAEEGKYADASESWFIARLGARVRTALEHLITPSSPLMRSHFHARVVVELFVVSDHQEFDPLDDKYFDVSAVKRELSRLALPPLQEFQFVTHRISLIEDRALASAFYSSLKTSVVPHLDATGTYSGKRRLVLDSRHLEHQLTDHVDLEGVELSDVRSKKLVVPIFLFSINTEAPLFVDGKYTAKALNSIIVAVQSPHRSTSSHLQCNGEPLLVDLMNPLRPVLSSAALFLGGLLPMHLSLSTTTKNITQEWMWSTGNSPCAMTGIGTSFSQLQIDTVHRHLCVSSLADVIDRLNAIVSDARIVPVRSVVGHWDKGLAKASENVQECMTALLRQLRLAAGLAGELRFAPAVSTLGLAEEELGRLKNEVDSFKRKLEKRGLVIAARPGKDSGDRCVRTAGEAGRPYFAYGFLVLLFFATISLCLVRVCAVPRARRRVKLN